MAMSPLDANCAIQGCASGRELQTYAKACPGTVEAEICLAGLTYHGAKFSPQGDRIITVDPYLLLPICK